MAIVNENFPAFRAAYHCEELVKDIGDLPQNILFYIVIDWEATANNLEADYTTVDFDGVEYLVRCS